MKKRSRNVQTSIRLFIILFIVLCIITDMIYLKDSNILGNLHKDDYYAFRIDEELRLNNRLIRKDMMKKFYQSKKKMLQNYYNRYGGKNEAMRIFDQGLISLHQFGNKSKSIEFTARRLVPHLRSGKPFHISFAGYSVVTGRGNGFINSYPSVLNKILFQLFDSVNIPLSIRNNGIGAIPDIPHAYCLQNYFSKETNVLTWDFFLTRLNSANSLETYLRHALRAFPYTNPMFIIMDMSANVFSRKQVLSKYINEGIIATDTLISINDFKYIPKMLFSTHKVNSTAHYVPSPGLQNWTGWGMYEFNINHGQNKFHLTLRQHELVAWNLAIYFLKALEMALEINLSNDIDIPNAQLNRSETDFPPPINMDRQEYASISFGAKEIRPKGKIQYKMNPVICYTSLEPKLKNDLSDIIAKGVNKNYSTALLDPTKEYLSGGWILGLEAGERRAKQTTEPFNHFGYKDSKYAYIGSIESGPLEINLPLVHSSNDAAYNDSAKNFKILASNYLASLQLCHLKKPPFNTEFYRNNFIVTVGKSTIYQKGSTHNSQYSRRILNNQVLTGTERIAGRIGCFPIRISRDVELELQTIDGNKSPGLFLPVQVECIKVFEEKTLPCAITHVIMELRGNVLIQ